MYIIKILTCIHKQQKNSRRSTRNVVNEIKFHQYYFFYISFCVNFFLFIATYTYVNRTSNITSNAILKNNCFNCNSVVDYNSILNNICLFESVQILCCLRLLFNNYCRLYFYMYLTLFKLYLVGGFFAKTLNPFYFPQITLKIKTLHVFNLTCRI